MKRLTFTVVIEVSDLDEINVEAIENRVARSIISDAQLEIADFDEMGAEAKLVQISDFNC